MPETKGAIRSDIFVIMNVPTETGYQNVEYYCYIGKKFGGHYNRLPLKKWAGAPWSLHRAVWEDLRGLKMPKDHVIHHINEDPGDNRPENLTCMHKEKHNRHHHDVRAELRYYLYNGKQLDLFSYENYNFN